MSPKKASSEFCAEVLTKNGHYIGRCHAGARFFGTFVHLASQETQRIGFCGPHYRKSQRGLIGVIDRTLNPQWPYVAVGHFYGEDKEPETERPAETQGVVS